MRSLLVLRVARGAAGCAAEARVYGRAPYPDPAFDAAGYEVPAGHLPPPGECRIWYPDRPTGQQPPPGPCEDLYWRVPAGAVLVEG